jgi:hypothetical protein
MRVTFGAIFLKSFATAFLRRVARGGVPRRSGALSGAALEVIEHPAKRGLALSSC